MSNTAYTPGIGNAPFGNLPLNPQGSQYASQSGYTTAETILIEKAVRRAIFDAAPEQFNALKLVFQKEMIEHNNDEFEYLEKTFGRSAVESTGVVAAQAAVAGVPQQQTIPMTAASVTHLTPDLILVYDDGSKAVVKSIVGLNVLVESQTSAGLPAVAAGDFFAVQGTIVADGMDYFSNYEKLDTITRYNYIQFFLRAQRWARIELQKHINSGRTNYLQSDKEEKMRQFRTDLFVSFFNGTRGEFRISSNYIAKAMGGIYPTMVGAGSMTATTSLAGLRTNFETLGFKTNFKKEGGTRFIYGCDEMLYEISKIYKDPGTRYAPNDTVAKMNLKEYEIGTMKFVPVVTELFRERSCFPKSWARKILVLDQESINPVKMKGIPGMEMGGTLDMNGQNGTRENFKDMYIQGNLSLEFNNPIGCFSIDIV